MRVLLVEDNENDAVLIREAMTEAGVDVQLDRVASGADCLRFLRKEGEFSGAETPDLVLLDLKLPDLDGGEVMKQLTADERISHLPVIVLSTSDDETDVLALYRLRCSSYITKPDDFDQYVSTLQNIFSYWSTVVVLPDAD